MNRVYIVLGAHRSGTSFLIRCLRDAGIPIGAGGIRGEDIDFVNLNMSIIKNAGGIWRAPPSAERLVVSGEQHSQQIADLLEKKQCEMWGWKDPRQPLTIQSYLPHLLDDDVYLICIFRKPKRSAASLRRLGQASVENGLTMARTYTRRTLETIKTFMGIGD